MQGAAFLGAFFRTSPLLAREGVDRGNGSSRASASSSQKKFGHRGATVVEDNLRVIRRGFDQVRAVAPARGRRRRRSRARCRTCPRCSTSPDAEPGIGNPGRFWEQVCSLCVLGQDGIADPFAAISAIPAATGAVRDMSGVRHGGAASSSPRSAPAARSAGRSAPTPRFRDS